MVNCQVISDCSMHSHVQRGNEHVLNAGLTPSTMTGGTAFVWGNCEVIFR